MSKKETEKIESANDFRFMQPILTFVRYVIFVGLIIINILFFSLKIVDVDLSNYLIDPVCDFNSLAGVLFFSLCLVWMARTMRNSIEYSKQTVSIDSLSFHESQKDKIDEVKTDMYTVNKLERTADEAFIKIDKGVKLATSKGKRDEYVEMQDEVKMVTNQLEELKKDMKKRHSAIISEVYANHNEYFFHTKLRRFGLDVDSILFFFSFSASGYAALCVSYAILTSDFSQGSSCNVQSDEASVISFSMV